MLVTNLDTCHLHVPIEKNLYTKEATLVGCTNLDLIEIQSDISDTSSIYSIILIDNIEEITPTTDYTLINSFTSKPHGITKKYGITPYDMI